MYESYGIYIDLRTLLQFWLRRHVQIQMFSKQIDKLWSDVHQIV